MGRCVAISLRTWIGVVMAGEIQVFEELLTSRIGLDPAAVGSRRPCVP